MQNELKEFKQIRRVWSDCRICIDLVHTVDITEELLDVCHKLNQSRVVADFNHVSLNSELLVNLTENGLKLIIQTLLLI